MRRPFRKTPRRSDAPSPPPADPHPVAHPDRSQPRPDWAHLTRIDLTAGRAAPLTFYGVDFGRTVAGARSLVQRPARRPAAGAPAGLLRDAVGVDAVVAPPTVTATDDHGPRSAGVAVAPHRRPAVAPAGAQRLTRADGPAPEWSLAAPRRTPDAATPFDLGASADDDLGWTADDGFRSTRRVIRRRAEPIPIADPALLDSDTPDPAADGAPDERLAPTGPEVRYLPARGRRDERVAPPADVVVLVASATGEHVGDTVIDRSPETSVAADDMGAIAFTRHGVVHLPSELGPLDDPGVRAVVAHELTHVAQQRRLGGDVPPEDTPAGRRLEAEAQAVQRAAGPGQPVRPTFRRRRTERTVREGPVGTQRLSTFGDVYEGADHSSDDYSEVEPGSSDDIFTWQDREGEPTAWPARQEWARGFERQHSQRLQHTRDARYAQLIQTAGSAVDQAAITAARRQLDTALPYQFGKPGDITPYPEIALPGAGAPTGTPTATPRVAPTGGAGHVAPVAPPDPGRQAEADASRRQLRTMAVHSAHAADQYRAHPTELRNLDDLHAWQARRHTRERDMRLELLHAKRAANTAAPWVDLDAAESDQIRELLDEEMPSGQLDPALVTFLPDTDTSWGIDAQGNLRSQERATPVAPVAPHRTGGPERARGATTAVTDTAHPHPADAAETAPPTASSRVLDRIRATAPAAGFGVIELTTDALMAMMTRRREREHTLRRELLRAKLDDLGDRSQFPNDFVVALTNEELDAITTAAESEFPAIVGMGFYAGDEESSMSIGGTIGGPVAHPETVDDARARHLRETARSEGRPADTARATATPVTPAPVSPAPAVPAPVTPAPVTTPPAPAPTTPPAPTPAGAPVTADATPAAPSGAGAGLATATTANPAIADDVDPARVVEDLTEVDLDRLTRRLWSRIRRELRSELLIDRERAGVLADVR